MLPINLRIDPSFYNKEERCDYIISEEMKCIWAVELDLLNAFIRVCDENQLKYYAIGGTLLGAIRHNGFIPWDDDIDVAMPRKDYNRLCMIADSVFKKPYFFQTDEYDCGFNHSFARLRNSQTTAIPYYDVQNKMPYNQGIWIDIFPLDNIPDDNSEKQDWIKRVKKYHHLTWATNRLTTRYKTQFENETFSKKLRFIYGPILKRIIENFRIKNVFFLKHDKLIQKYSDIDTKQWGILWFYKNNEWTIWDKKDFEKIQMFPFEMLNVAVPYRYDLILTKQYGDWHIPVKGAAVHYGTIFDPSLPYQEYLVRCK